MAHVASFMTITNLAELLHSSNSDYLIYDLGRIVQPISASEFTEICAQQCPYPYPLQHHAWFAVVFWAAQQQDVDPFIWFLKMPVDERGLLSHIAQQEYMAQILALLGQQLTHALTDEQAQQLQQSPYLFTPAEAKRAALHAKLTLRWQREPSPFYDRARAELEHPTSDGWQYLGVQGIHDVIARLLPQEEITKTIAANFANYPEPLQNAVAEAFEHSIPAPSVVEQLQPLIQHGTGISRLNALRALTGGASEPTIAASWEARLDQASVDELIVIAARHWPALAASSQRLERYLVQVAKQDNPALFAGLVRDLLQLPCTRAYTLSLLQRNDLPAVLYLAWQQFIQTHSA